MLQGEVTGRDGVDWEKQARQIHAGERFGELEWKTFDEFLQLCRTDTFRSAPQLRLEMYEALVDVEKYAQMKEEIFGT